MVREIKEIIKFTLEHLDMYSEDAASLVYRTGMAESSYKHLRQVKGPAIGFFQVEPATIIDTVSNYVDYRPELRTKLWSLGWDDTKYEQRVLSSIALQAAFCRLKYRRDSKPLPKADDVMGQAKYWKRIYNSEHGKGTVEHFMRANGYEGSI
tara:strand:- start:536 stop:991 length:456 start_codon:yes stop_codon:yes gene_type:complete